MDLTGYLAARFPGLTLGPALFYEWPIGIRFELNDESRQEPDFSKIVSRATTIYRDVFQPKDEVAVVAQKHPADAEHPKHAREPKGLFELAEERHFDFSEMTERLSIATEDGAALLEWAGVVNISNEEVSAIFGAIGNLDFSRTPRITDRVYFVNQSRDIILNMYDDRGLDVIAADRASLLPLYRSHFEWILTYDVPQIERTFEGL